MCSSARPPFNAPRKCHGHHLVVIRKESSSLVTDSHQVGTQFLDCVGRRARLDRLRVVCDKECLLRLDDDNPFLSLKSMSGQPMFVQPMPQRSNLLAVETGVVRLDDDVLLPANVETRRLDFLGRRRVLVCSHDLLHFLRRHLKAGRSGPDAGSFGIEDCRFIDMARADEAVEGSD